jgi:hypothetical protein
MATRSRIGIELKNGSVKSVYHHWDGYPEWLGKKLKSKYNTRAKVHALIRRGDISCLESSTDWNNRKLSNPIVLTYRMRGDNCSPRIDEDITEYIHNSEEYSYIFTKDNEWICYDYTPAICEIPS